MPSSILRTLAFESLTFETLTGFSHQRGNEGEREVVGGGFYGHETRGAEEEGGGSGEVDLGEVEKVPVVRDDKELELVIVKNFQR